MVHCQSILSPWDDRLLPLNSPFVLKIAVECKGNQEVSARTDKEDRGEHAVCHILGIPFLLLLTS